MALFTSVYGIGLRRFAAERLVIALRTRHNSTGPATSYSTDATVFELVTRRNVFVPRKGIGAASKKVIKSWLDARHLRLGMECSLQDVLDFASGQDERNDPSTIRMPNQMREWVLT